MESNVYHKSSRKLPFYEFPKERRSSAEIIREAKASLCMVETKRPFTPEEPKRSLHGIGDGTETSPSNLSLNSFFFDISTEAPSPSFSPGHSRSSRASHRSFRRNNSKTPEIHLTPNISQIVISRPPSRKTPIPPASRKSPIIANWSKAPNKVSLKSDPIKSSDIIEHSPSFTIKEDSKQRNNKDHSEGLSGSLSTISISTVSLERKRKLFASSAGNCFKEPLEISTSEPKLCPKKALLDYVRKLDQEIQKEFDLTKGLSIIQNLTKILEEINWDKIPERTLLLKSLYKWLNPLYPEFCLEVGKIILGLKVSGINLASFCKLIYKFTKDSDLDGIFISNSAFLGLYIKSLHTATLTEDGLLYALASIKFLSSNPNLVPILSSFSCMNMVLFHFSRLLSTDKTGSEDENNFNQILCIFCHLVELKDNIPLLMPHFRSLVTILTHWLNSKTIVFSTTRVLSKLSTDINFCSVFNSQDQYLAALLSTLAQYTDEQEIVVRICFILGNLLTFDTRIAKILYKAYPLYTYLLKSYMQKCVELETCDYSQDKEVQLNADVLLKLVRVITNMSVNEEVGPAIANNHSLVNLLLNLADLSYNSELQEAIMCTLITLNNLSYYLGNQDNNNMASNIACRITPFLTNGNLHHFVETTRILENLACNVNVRVLLVNQQVMSSLLTIIEANNSTMAKESCGLLGNLLLDHSTRVLAVQNGLVPKVLKNLSCVNNDWTLAGLLCQVLWNLSCGNGNWCPFTPTEMRSLKTYLETALSQKKSLQEDAEWNTQFQPFAEDLFKRLTKDNSC